MKKTNLLIISVVSLLALFGVSLSFAANTDRNVYGVYTENYNGAHMYGINDSVPTSDEDGIKFYPWDTSGWDPSPHVIMSATTVDSTDSDPAPEGKQYIRYLWGSVEQSYSTTYVGCSYTRVSGISSKSSINMSAYAGGKIKFSARSNKEYAKKCKIGFELANGTQSWFPTTLTNINENWQEFSFDIPSSIGDVSVIFMMMIDGEPEHTVGEAFLDIDNIRWVKSGAGSFDVKLKNVSDGTEVSTVTWSQDVFRNGWKASEQYLEFDLDQDTSKDWHIKIYTTNGVAGLKASDGMSPSLPMCWRIDKEKIPYDYSASGGYKATFSIAQAGEEHNYGLYDSGVSATDPYYYPWFYFVDKEDSGFDDKTDYMTVWSYKGFHAADNGDYWGMSDMNTNGKKIAPKLYFGADFSKAIAGSTGSPITYTSNIKVEFVNE